MTDITQHKTGEGKRYLCAVKEVFPVRIVGYSIKARLTVTALRNAVAMRGDVAGCVVYSDRGSQFHSWELCRELAAHQLEDCDGQGRVLW